MRRWRILTTLAIVMFVLLAAASGVGHRFEDRWRNPDFEPREFENLLIIGIADLDEERKQFENKFVSHLRGRGIQGVPSYSVAPRLDQVHNREALARQLEELGVDGAITVRLVPLKSLSPAEWAVRWDGQMEAFGTIRELIDETLPVKEVKSKTYGVEAALWEGDGWTRVWGGRTDVYKRKELTKESANFVQMTMRALRDAMLLQ